MPLSTMQTRAPAPVEPPQAQSRVDPLGQRRRQRDRVDARRGQAPGRQPLVVLFVLVRAQGAHRDCCPAPCKDRTMITCERCGRESCRRRPFLRELRRAAGAAARAGGAEGRDGAVRRPRRVHGARGALDPEDVRAVLSPFYARLRSELERFGGTVEKFIGDAVMAVFGAPVAHEDDPERAVRAALAIRDWAAEERELQVRIAVHTGEALVSLGARPAAGEGMVAGDVVNTAARMQAAAPVNGDPRRRADLPRDGARRRVPRARAGDGEGQARADARLGGGPASLGGRRRRAPARPRAARRAGRRARPARARVRARDPQPRAAARDARRGARDRQEQAPVRALPARSTRARRSCSGVKAVRCRTARASRSGRSARWSRRKRASSTPTRPPTRGQAVERGRGGRRHGRGSLGRAAPAPARRPGRRGRSRRLRAGGGVRSLAPLSRGDRRAAPARARVRGSPLGGRRAARLRRRARRVGERRPAARARPRPGRSC